MRTHPSVTRRGAREGDGLRSRLTCIGGGTEKGVELEADEGTEGCISWIADSSGGTALSEVEDGGWAGAAVFGGTVLRRLGIGMRGVTVFRSRSVSRISDAEARDFEEVGRDAEAALALVCPWVDTVLSFSALRKIQEGSSTSTIAGGGDSWNRWL